MALATAKLFVEEGAYVFITGRRQQKLDEAVKAIGKNVTGVQGDASNLADLDRLYDMVKQKKGRIDVLFASAGYGDLAPIGAMTEAHFDKVFGVNVRGTVFTVQKALPLFSDGGSIIMNASIASVKGLPGLGAYCASKAALRSFARTWTLDLKQRNIRVNVISPGTIDTPILDGLPKETVDWFVSLIREAPWADPRKSLLLSFSSRPATPVLSLAASCSLTAAWRRSESVSVEAVSPAQAELGRGSRSSPLPRKYKPVRAPTGILHLPIDMPTISQGRSPGEDTSG